MVGHGYRSERRPRIDNDKIEFVKQKLAGVHPTANKQSLLRTIKEFQKLGKALKDNPTDLEPRIVLRSYFEQDRDLVKNGLKLLKRNIDFLSVQDKTKVLSAINSLSIYYAKSNIFDQELIGLCNSIISKSLDTNLSNTIAHIYFSLSKISCQTNVPNNIQAFLESNFESLNREHKIFYLWSLAARDDKRGLNHIEFFLKNLPNLDLQKDIDSLMLHAGIAIGVYKIDQLQNLITPKVVSDPITPQELRVDNMLRLLKDEFSTDAFNFKCNVELFRIEVDFLVKVGSVIFVLEVDGKNHSVFDFQQKKYLRDNFGPDQIQDRIFNNLGIPVLHITNDQVESLNNDQNQLWSILGNFLNSSHIQAIYQSKVPLDINL